MAAPEEVLAYPLQCWLAIVGTTMPMVDIDPPTPWELLGTEGDLNYGDTGVVVSHGETVFDFTPAGSTMPSKRFRTAESLLTKLDLVDLSPAVYAKVMNDAALTTVAASAGIAGNDSFSLFRGDEVNAFAVLLRGPSPVDNTLNMQYEIPKAFVSVNGDVTFNKGVVASLPIEIQMIRHASADDPICRIETAPAS
jgi:hypothetical protein